MPKIIMVILAVLALLVLIAGGFYFYYFNTHYIKAPALKYDLKQQSILIDGKNRTFSWYGSGTAKPTTILFVFHGSRSDGLSIREQTSYEFDLLAEKHGFIVVYPDGYKNHWNDCRQSATYEANTENIDDLKFIKTIEQALSQSLNTQFRQRFATGLSNGGHFCYKLAHQAPDWITAIAPIAAGLPVDDNSDCIKKDAFVPILLINGTADKINPHQGGLVKIFSDISRGIVHSSEETMAYWTGLDSCEWTIKTTLLPSEDSASIEKREWSCNGKTQASLFIILEGGHTIPHPKVSFPRILGITNHDMNGPQVIWDFFEEQLK